MVMEMNASDENMTVCVSVCVFACVYVKRCVMNTAIQVSHFVTWQTSLCVQKIGLEQVCLSFACTVDDAVFKCVGRWVFLCNLVILPSPLGYRLLVHVATAGQIVI